MKIISNNLSDTLNVAQALGKVLRPGDVVALQGTLGAGKTRFVEGMSRSFDLHKGYQVSSPSYVYQNIYHGRCPIYHLDLYRVESEEDVEMLGLDQSSEGQGITIIEWFEKFPGAWNQPQVNIFLDILSEDSRNIIIEPDHFLHDRGFSL
ncbi:MAG: tRNA (adenosine(37)-N6)-threonylcarbamoyltransferase complex ATPase subunit type 1 TsaE [Bdellovibrionota bacterium]